MSGVGVDSFASSDGGNPDSGNTITSASKRIRRIKMIVNTVFNRIERLFDQPLFLMIANSVSCMLCCVGVILWVDFSMTTTQPGIWVYNLLHTALSSVGGMIIFFTLNMLNLIEDCEMSCTITWRRGDVIPGVTLSEIGERTQRVLRIYNASRFLYMSSRWVMLLSIWLLSLNLEWTPEITPIGNHDCIPPTYIPNTYNPSVAVGHFIAGATTYAEVYMYGLPLSDGVFGGLSGWPLEAPLNSFIVRSEGPVYAVKTSCDDAVEIVPYDDSRTWSDRWSNLTATLSFLNDTTQTWSITTVYPQGSVIEFNGTVQQTCSATMRFGSGYASYQYVVDEWDMVTGGQMSFVRTGSLSVVQGQSAKYSFADVTAHMSDPNEVHRIISNWTALTIAAVMNADYMPSQGGLFSNLMQWSTMPDGYYHVDENARGVAAVLSAIMQYVTMQYDGSQSEPCEYFGSTGAGRISVHQHWFIFFMASTLLTLTMTLIMFIRWSVKYRRGDYSMRTVVSLRHPLIMARDMRSIMNQFTRQAKSSRGGVSSRRDFHKWCSRQHVLFGEIASSPTHELGFGLKSNIRPCDPDKVSANQSGLVL
nr:hypothetical protein HK105_000515 [Polyrhizophydium stewartii]